MDSFDKLVEILGKLPGIGRKSAERMAIKLVRDRDGLMKDLDRALADAIVNVSCCTCCGSITPSDRDPCRLCTDVSRDDSILCVVEDPSDIVMLERSGEYRGRYHALMGKISPMKGDGASRLRVNSLLERVQKGGVKEVVLALSTDVEGDSTSSFLTELLGKENVKITRLAFGLPAGSGISYSDPVTLARAIKGRVDG